MPRPKKCSLALRAGRPRPPAEFPQPPPPVQIPDLPQRLVAAESPQPGIAVVVCTYRRPRELERCLRSLRQQVFPPVEIVVADNAPSGPAARRVAEAAGARYVAVPVRGVSRARNAGARQCSVALVAFIDDDMVAHPLWLQRLVTAFADPLVMAVSGHLVPDFLPLGSGPPIPGGIYIVGGVII